ncbi:hypothetical protein HMPREF9682_01793 [Streptococcus intermedius F0395]|uniref:hypothetical protein n=3 Tax=Streptococcus constellatus TaxID=76860 RepID=UPI0002329BA0|nr:hypothetical protein [Streptococcus constellatus]EHG11397.1 hypothetical protein HMPREF9682_01793 [Streptococcus intermedius F0395]
MNKELITELFKRIFLFICFISILIFLVVIQYFINGTQGLTESLSKPLDGNLLEIYSFIVSLLSLFGIYFAIIQFAVEMSSNNNTFFGINYARVILESSYLIKFLKSKLFYILLGLLTILPVIYKVFKDYLLIILHNSLRMESFTRIISYSWNSIALILLLVFVISLYVGFSKIWNITANNDLHKHQKCYNKVKYIVSQLYEEYIASEEEKYGPDPLDIFFYSISDLIYKFEESNNEPDYFLNNLLENIDFKNIKRKDEFIGRYLDFVNNKNMKLIPLDENMDYNYTFLRKIGENANLNYVYMGTSIFDKIQTSLNNQDTIRSDSLADFIKAIFNQCSYKMTNDLVNIYLNKCSLIIPLEISLLQLGDTNHEDINEYIDIYSKLFNIWIKLFSQHEQKQIELLFPENGQVSLPREYTYLSVYKNIFVYASIYYKNNNPNSKILKYLYNSLGKICKAIYDGELEMGNSDIDEVNKDLYAKLVRNYSDILSS